MTIFVTSDDYIGIMATRFSLPWTGRGQYISLQWRHNGRDSGSNHQPHDCLLKRFIQTQIKENIKAPRHWPLWGEIASNAENVSIWWRHHVDFECDGQGRIAAMKRSNHLIILHNSTEYSILLLVYMYNTYTCRRDRCAHVNNMSDLSYVIPLKM